MRTLARLLLLSLVFIGCSQDHQARDAGGQFDAQDAGTDAPADPGADPVPDAGDPEDEPWVDAEDGFDGGQDEDLQPDAGDPGADEDEPTCDPELCQGCCPPAGACLSGDDDLACGFGGVPCLDCTSVGLVCQDMMCINPDRLPNGYVDDSQIHLSDPVTAMHMRRNLIRFLWKVQPFPPMKLPDVVTTDVASPVGPLEGLSRVDLLEINMELEFSSSVHLFHPVTPVNRVMIYHQGHSDTLGENGGLETIQYFLGRGYHVLALCMPLKCGNPGSAPDHEGIFSLAVPGDEYHPMKFFVEPVLVALNHIRTTMIYEDTSMIGISGGGWTTTLVAALEPTIMNNFPVAGSLPLYMRQGPDIGDAEQHHTPFYQIAGYLDLYTLGSFGCRRRYVQVLNRHDSCCFAGTRYQEFEARIQSALLGLATTGTYRVFLDESDIHHLISLHALETSIIHELDQDLIQIADDITPVYGAFAAQGDWTVWTFQDNVFGFGGDLLAAPAGAGEAAASWTFEVLPGTYRVSAHWVENPNRASNAPFTILAPPPETVLFDQRLAPVGFEEAGVVWQDLGGLHDVTGTTLVIELSNQADGYVIADAIRIQPFDL